MKWGSKQHQQKPTSISDALPLSWFSKLKRISGKPNPKPHPPKPSRNTKPKTKPQPLSKSTIIGSSSDYLSFSPEILDRMITARFPPSYVTGDDPHRLSAGDQVPMSFFFQGRASHERRVSRLRRHNSASELELRPVCNCTADIELDKSRNLDETFLRKRIEGVRKPRRSDQKGDPNKEEENRGQFDYLSKRGPRKSISGRIRHRTKPRVRVCSPRAAAALNLKAEKCRVKAAEKRVVEEEETGLERFAVVKCSCDPRKDFRDSMVEMICVRGIERPEELESLLACYLFLNSEQHHDVIVKVFRQVWFDFNSGRFGAEPEHRQGHGFGYRSMTSRATHVHLPQYIDR